MLSFVDTFEGINHRYFNRKQYWYLQLRKRNQFLNRVKALCWAVWWYTILLNPWTLIKATQDVSLITFFQFSSHTIFTRGIRILENILQLKWAPLTDGQRIDRSEARFKYVVRLKNISLTRWSCRSFEPHLLCKTIPMNSNILRKNGRSWRLSSKTA